MEPIYKMKLDYEKIPLVKPIKPNLYIELVVVVSHHQKGYNNVKD